MRFDALKTLTDMFHARAAESAARTAMRVKKDGQWRDIAWSEVSARFKAMAAGLCALGVNPGDRVAILSENRPEWAYADMGILCAAAIDVPIYATNIPSQCEYILQNSGAVACFVSNEGQLKKILESLKGAPDLRHVIVFDTVPDALKGEKVIALEELLKRGEAKLKEAPGLLDERAKAISEDQPASFIYTSGTTGDPKGVILTHRNFLSNAKAIVELIQCGAEDVFLSFLPLSHSFERMSGYYAPVLGGSVIAYAESVDKVRDNLPEVRPTIMSSVPRLYEKIYAGINEIFRTAPPLRRKIAEWGLGVGRAHAKEVLANRNPGGWLNFQRGIADRLVFSKIRARFGGRLRFFVSGGAALSKEIADFFYAAGIVILEGYGLTETSPVITVNLPGKQRPGTVGFPIPGVEVKINPEPEYPAGEGEIWCRGPNVMKGYYKNEQASKEVLTEDGWFKTGDIGKFDEDGYLKITDRKKDLLKTSGGKYIAPQNLENEFKTDRFIGEFVVIAENRNYPTALVVPKFEALEPWAREEKIAFSSRAELVKHEKVKALLQQRMDEKNKHLAQYEKIKKFRLLDTEFSQERGELTPTMKVKRKVVNKMYADVIQEMYAEGGGKE